MVHQHFAPASNFDGHSFWQCTETTCPEFSSSSHTRCWHYQGAIRQVLDIPFEELGKAISEQCLHAGNCDSNPKAYHLNQQALSLELHKVFEFLQHLETNVSKNSKCNFGFLSWHPLFLKSTRWQRFDFGASTKNQFLELIKAHDLGSQRQELVFKGCKPLVPTPKSQHFKVCGNTQAHRS